jgi:hypothetical protein
MRRRILAILACVVLLLICGVMFLATTSVSQHTGSAAGINYSFAHSGFYGYSFAPSSNGFRYVRRTWFGLGSASLEVAVERGRLLVDQLDYGPISAGDQLTVTRDSRVLKNDQMLLP